MSIEKSFTAHSHDGKFYTIHLLGDDKDKSDRHGLSSTERQWPTLHTSDGLHVSRLGKGRYQLIETGILLESADPNAC